jgi:hypothetical protein
MNQRFNQIREENKTKIAERAKISAEREAVLNRRMLKQTTLAGFIKTTKKLEVDKWEIDEILDKQFNYCLRHIHHGISQKRFNWDIPQTKKLLYLYDRYKDDWSSIAKHFGKEGISNQQVCWRIQTLKNNNFNFKQWKDVFLNKN